MKICKSSDVMHPRDDFLYGDLRPLLGISSSIE